MKSYPSIYVVCTFLETNCIARFQSVGIRKKAYPKIESLIRNRYIHLFTKVDTPQLFSLFFPENLHSWEHSSKYS